jgi:hypothetical protein
MVRSRRPHKALIASLAGALLLLQGWLVPRLEADDSGHRTVLESEHSDATCVVGHDHTICMQVGANRAHTTPAVGFHLAVLALTRALHRTPIARVQHAVEFAGHPRGPPAA